MYLEAPVTSLRPPGACAHVSYTTRWDSTPGLSSLAHLYSVMADILRDQIAAQLESASTNNLESVGVIAAALAFVVALLVVRATHGNDPSWWWWWYPLPGFMIPTAIVGTPLLPPTKKRQFQDGPDIPSLLEGFAASSTTLEEMLAILLQGLQASWEENDKLLRQEAWCLKWGLISFSLITIGSIGVYTWGLR